MTNQTSTEERVLVIGALGQLGLELVEALQQLHGEDAVLATDIRIPEEGEFEGMFMRLDVMDRDALFRTIEDYEITSIYHLAAILSAKGEEKPDWAWKLNMDSLMNVLEAGRHTRVNKIFWPSSIAVFGPNSPKDFTPQDCIMDPNTVYGISKLAGERWCEYYHSRYDVDVRSLRYPGLIGYKTPPGGGTTDYAVDIFHKAIETGHYNCYLEEDAFLPMMYMPDAIRATLELMHAPTDSIQLRSSYNLAGMSFSPEEVVAAIQTHLPAFSCEYQPDFRQKIADSWPNSIDDSRAQMDWNWHLKFDLPAMTEDMIRNIKLQKEDVLVC